MPNLFRTRTMELDTATQTQGVEFNIPGHLFQIVAVSSASVRVEVQIDDRNGEWAELREGMGWEHQRFNSLWIRWDAQPGQTVTVAWGGNPQDADPSRLRLFTASNQSSVIVSNPSPIDVSIEGFVTHPVQQDDQFIVRGQALTSVASLLSAHRNAAGVLTGASSIVPVGKELVVVDAAVGSNDSRGGVLFARVGGFGGTTIFQSFIIHRQASVGAMVGMVFPPGTEFVLAPTSSSYAIWAGVSGYLRDV